MYPDLVWYPGSGGPGLVVDAKYKVDAVPNADVYQLLAYCTALGLSEGHLVYARGAGEARVYEVRGAGVRIVAHAVDLGLEPEGLRRQVEGLADALIRYA